MDLPTATAVIATASAAVNLFDKVADQVVRFISKTPEPPGPPKEYTFKVDGSGSELNVEANGQVIQTITGADLQNLPPGYLEHIKTYELAVKRNYELWKQVYPLRNSSGPLENAKVNLQLQDLALAMKDDLTGIIDFLGSIGVRLDDHYMIYRDVINKYDGDKS